MYKKYLIVIFVLFSGCSIDNKTGIWNNKLETSTNEQVSNFIFDEKLSFDEFKKNLILYGKKSDFPKLDK